MKTSICILDSDNLISVKSILNWNPDLDPNRFRSGKGHALYQLANILHNNDFDVSFLSLKSYRDTMRHSCCIYIIYAKDRFSLLSQLYLLIKILKSNSYLNIIRIMSDANDDDVNSFFHDTFRIVSNRDMVFSEKDIFIPHLIQFGIKKFLKNENTIGTIVTRGNVPEQFLSLDFKKIMSQSKFDELSIKYTDVDDLSDYSCFRYFVCARADLSRSFNKPPTKILNALNAGCIPIIFDNDHNSLSFTYMSDSIIVAKYSSDPAVLAKNIFDAIDIYDSCGSNSHRILNYTYTKEGIINQYLSFFKYVSSDLYSAKAVLNQKFTIVFSYAQLLVKKIYFALRRRIFKYVHYVFKLN